MSPIITTLLLLTSAIPSVLSRSPIPPGLGEGTACTTSGGLIGPPIPCAAGLVCVLTTFGNPPVDLPNGGTCRLLKATPPACTVAFCSSVGTSGVCTISSQTATCGAWATRFDLGGMRPVCTFPCTKECRVPRVIASDGSQHCTLCVLQDASCSAGFSFYGPDSGGGPPTKPPVTRPPVTRPPSGISKCKRPISIFNAGECCDVYKIGCLLAGTDCSTTGSRIRPVACQAGLKCVLTDLGFPAVDRPNRGTCQRVRGARKCSVRFCSRKGARAVCKTGSDCTTCWVWATRSDGGVKPNCRFSCSRRCLPKHRWVRASDGSRHCNKCVLSEKSCLGGFTVYGPVRKY